MALTARELAEFIGAKLLGDDSVVVSGVAAPESAGPQDLIYLRLFALSGSRSRFGSEVCPGAVGIVAQE